MGKYIGTTGLTYLWGKLKTAFQDKLVSGTNIKTINNQSLLGSGNISIQGGGGDIDITFIPFRKMGESGTWEINSGEMTISEAYNALLSNPYCCYLHLVWSYEVGEGLIETETYDLIPNTVKYVEATGFIIAEYDGCSAASSCLVEASLSVSSESAHLYFEKTNVPYVNNSTVTLRMNGSSVGSFTLNKSTSTTIDFGTVITSHQSLKTINGNSIVGTGDLTVSGLPTVTSSDNDKMLQVVSGSWALVTPPAIYSGSTTPSSSLGKNGDIYIKTS